MTGRHVLHAIGKPSSLSQVNAKRQHLAKAKELRINVMSTAPLNDHEEREVLAAYVKWHLDHIAPHPRKRIAALLGVSLEFVHTIAQHRTFKDIPPMAPPLHQR